MSILSYIVGHRQVKPCFLKEDNPTNLDMCRYFKIAQNADVRLGPDEGQSEDPKEDGSDER